MGVVRGGRGGDGDIDIRTLRDTLCYTTGTGFKKLHLTPCLAIALHKMTNYKKLNTNILLLYVLCIVYVFIAM